MSDVAGGPGWWFASDGKWYPPEQAPGPPPAGPPGYGPPGYGPPEFAPPYPTGDAAPGGAAFGVPLAGPPPYGDPAYGDPAYGYGGGVPPYGYPQGPPAYGYVPVRKTNGLAIASFVCSFFFWLYGVGAILAIVFGFIARSQIKKSEGMQGGGGLALAGIIIGFAGLVIGVGVIIAIAALVHHCDVSNNCTLSTNFNSN